MRSSWVVLILHRAAAPTAWVGKLTYDLLSNDFVRREVMTRLPLQQLIRTINPEGFPKTGLPAKKSFYQKFPSVAFGDDVWFGITSEPDGSLLRKAALDRQAARRTRPNQAPDMSRAWS